MVAIVLDTETTGLDPSLDRVVELAVVTFEGDNQFHSLFNPGIPIPPDVSKIHGITDEKVKDAPTFSEYADEIRKLIHVSEAVAGQNPFFDIRMLDAEFHRLDMEVTWPTIVCTKRIWDIYEPKERNLQNAFKRFVRRDGFEGAHGALADTLACREVLRAQIEEFGLHDKLWDKIDGEQSQWYGPTHHIVWKDGVLVINFGKHKGTPCDEVDKGYWQWIGSKDFPEHVHEVADYLMGVNPGASAAALATWAYGRRK